MKRTLIVILLAASVSCAGCLEVKAQKWSISTNLIDYLNFGTVNAEISLSVDKHWNISLSGRYNPFYFDFPSRPIVNKKAFAALGARYWPFFVHSGIYYGFGVQGGVFRNGGIFSENTREGHACGGTFELGYSLILSKHLNLEFGFGLWTGASVYKKYDSTRCGKKLKEGIEPFLALNELQINLLYNF